MGARAYIIKDGKMKYSHWGADMLRNGYIYDWEKFKEEVEQRYEEEEEKTETAPTTEKEIIKLVDLCIEAVYVVENGNLTAYTREMIYHNDILKPRANEKPDEKVIYRIQNETEFYYYFHGSRRLSYFQEAYRRIGLKNAGDVAYEQALRDFTGDLDPVPIVARLREEA